MVVKDLSEQLNSETDCNGNLVSDRKERIERITSSNKTKSQTGSALPLADKKVSITEAQDLLMQSKSNALQDLSVAGLTPSLEELSSVNFVFENVVFEGGGVKGIAYVGAVKVGKYCVYSVVYVYNITCLYSFISLPVASITCHCYVYTLYLSLYIYFTCYVYIV